MSIIDHISFAQPFFRYSHELATCVIGFFVGLIVARMLCTKAASPRVSRMVKSEFNIVKIETTEKDKTYVVKKEPAAENPSSKLGSPTPNAKQGPLTPNAVTLAPKAFLTPKSSGNIRREKQKKSSRARESPPNESLAQSQTPTTLKYTRKSMGSIATPVGRRSARIAARSAEKS